MSRVESRELVSGGGRGKRTREERIAGLGNSIVG